MSASFCYLKWIIIMMGSSKFPFVFTIAEFFKIQVKKRSFVKVRNSVNLYIQQSENIVGCCFKIFF